MYVTLQQKKKVYIFIYSNPQLKNKQKIFILKDVLFSSMGKNNGFDGFGFKASVETCKVHHFYLSVTIIFIDFQES